MFLLSQHSMVYVCSWPKAACRKTSGFRRSVRLTRVAFIASYQPARKTLSDRWVVGNGTLDHFPHHLECSAVGLSLAY